MPTVVNVWDPLVRIIHWLLLLLFCLSYITGEQDHWLHIYSGYSIFMLISVRLVWGFFGSKYARFSDFIYSPSAIIHYLKGLRSANNERFIGHNPAGGVMIVALLSTLFLTTLSGMKLYAIEEGLGPFSISEEVTAQSANLTSEQKKEQREKQEAFWEETHEIAVKLMLLLIILHVIGVFISSRHHNENLTKSMFNGKKLIHKQ